MLWLSRYKVGCDLPGKYRVALDSDAWEFGGHGRVRNSVELFVLFTKTCLLTNQGSVDL